MVWLQITNCIDEVAGLHLQPLNECKELGNEKRNGAVMHAYRINTS